MTERLARAVLEITTDTAGLLRGIDESISKSEFFQLRVNSLGRDLQRFGSQTESVGRTLSFGLTAPLLGAATAAVKLASDSIESGNKFDVVFGGAADRAKTRLQALTAVIPLTTGEMMGLAAGVQDLLVPMGVAREEAADMSVGMVELAGDLGSFNNVPTAKVLEDIQSALAGSSEPMQKYGVDTRVANLEAIALKNGLIQQGQELNRTARAQAVLLAIQEGSTDAMGDAARTADEFANATRLLWRDLRELGEMIGGTIIPIIRPYIVQMRDWVAGLKELTPEQQLLIVKVGALAAAVGPALIIIGKMATGLGAIVTTTGSLVTGFGRLSGSLGGSLSVIARATSMLGVRGGLAMALRIVAGAISGPVGVVVGVGLMLARFAPFQRLLGSLLRALIAVGRQGVGFVADKFQDLLRWIKPVTDRIAALVSWAGEKLGGAMDWASEGLDDFTESLEESGNAIEIVGGGVRHLAPQLPPLTDDVEDVSVATEQWGEQLDQTTDAIERQEPKIGDLAAALQPVEGAYSGAALAVLELSDSYDELARSQAIIEQGLTRMPDIIPADEIVADAQRVDVALGTGGTGGGLLGSLGEFFTQAGITVQQGVGALTNALGNLLTGGFGGMVSSLGNALTQMLSQVFNSVLPGLGAIAAPLIGAIGSLFAGLFDTANAAEHAAEQFGFQLSQSLSDQIDQVAQSFGGDLDAAIRTTLDDIIAELGVTAGNFDTFVTKIHQIFSSVDEGAFTVTEAIGHIGDALQQLIPQMADAGGSAMDLQSMFSDMISRARAEGQDLSTAVIPTIQAAIDAMIANGVEGVGELVGWLQTLGIELEGVGQYASRGAQQAAEAWDWWQEQAGGSYQEAERHNRAFFEAIATQMGLTGDTFDAWVEGMLKRQREAERERIKSNREMWRQQAIDVGLTGDQITEYVNAQIRLQRQAEREARREERQERRQNVVDQVEDGKLVRDRLMQFIDQIGARWSSMYEQASADASNFANSVNFSAPSGSGGSPAGSFADGTGFQFLDFGASSLAYLHGEEAVINREQADSLVGMLRGSVAAGLAGAMEHARSTSGGGDGRALAAQRESNRELRDQISGLRRDLLTSFVTIAERAGRHGALTAGRR